MKKVIGVTLVLANVLFFVLNSYAYSTNQHAIHFIGAGINLGAAALLTMSLAISWDYL